MSAFRVTPDDRKDMIKFKSNPIETYGAINELWQKIVFTNIGQTAEVKDIFFKYSRYFNRSNFTANLSRSHEHSKGSAFLLFYLFNQQHKTLLKELIFIYLSFHLRGRVCISYRKSIA